MAKAQLIVTVEGQSRRVDLDSQPLTVGRHPTSELCLPDDRLSRHHCVIDLEQQFYKVTDLGSRNGVKLNGQRITSAYLKSGDVLKLGHSLLQFVWPDQPEPLPEPRVTLAAAQAAPPFAAFDRDDDEDDAVELDEPILIPDDPILEYPDAMQRLREMSANLPRLGFDERQLAMLNARREVADIAEGSEAESGGALLRLLLTVGIQTTATDLHFEPRTEYHAVRMRVDGMMVDVVRLTNDSGIRLMGVVKVLCEIDISRRQVVQEGHFSAITPGRKIDYRVSFTPALGGQKLVLRVLDTANAPQHTSDLALPKPVFDEIRNVTRREGGMVMVCGPTGSGKTTTLYAIIRDLDLTKRNVITIEDPVEYQIEGITQMPVNEQLGNTFASLLRSVLRQDPDVILLGEIRDPETARIAVQAAVTGHLVLTTLHARDGVGSVFRLIDLGVEPQMVASAMNLVVSQRLVRQLCSKCKQATAPTPSQRKRLGKYAASVQKIYRPRGCAHCLGTGYLGRRAVFELLTATQEIRDVLLGTPTMAAMREAMNKNDMPTLYDSGIRLVAKGFTSLAEIERVIGAD